MKKQLQELRVEMKAGGDKMSRLIMFKEKPGAEFHNLQIPTARIVFTEFNIYCFVLFLTISTAY